MTAPGYHVMIPFLTTVKIVQTTLQTDEGRKLNEESVDEKFLIVFSEKYPMRYEWRYNDLLR